MYLYLLQPSRLSMSRQLSTHSTRVTHTPGGASLLDRLVLLVWIHHCPQLVKDQLCTVVTLVHRPWTQVVVTNYPPTCGPSCGHNLSTNWWGKLWPKLFTDKHTQYTSNKVVVTNYPPTCGPSCGHNLPPTGGGSCGPNYSLGKHTQYTSNKVVVTVIDITPQGHTH